MINILCEFCGAQLIRISEEEWACPTCRDITASEYNKQVNSLLNTPKNAFENIGDKNSFIESLQDTIDSEILLKKLPIQQRLVMLGRMNGYTYKEIATMMGIKESTVLEHIKRASVKIKSLIHPLKSL